MLPIAIVCQDLHSNMVRFIIKLHCIIQTTRKIIYIPIWLDLLLLSLTGESTARFNLHSNMVRFIINTCSCDKLK